jgi:hypothetical protein
MVEWTGRTHTKISTFCPLLQRAETWNHTKVKEWVMYTVPLPGHVLVDEALLAKHPSVLGSLLARRTPAKPVLKPVKKRRKPPAIPKVVLTPVVRKAPGRPRLTPVSQVSKPKKALPTLTPVVARRSGRLSERV